MPKKFTNNTASPIGLYDTDTVCHVAGAMGGYSVLNPSMLDQQVIDVLVADGSCSSQDVTAPANTVAPSITGTPGVSEVLTASTGTWTGTATISYGYQWQISADGVDDWSDIEGEDESTYTVAVGDVDSYIRVTVTATNIVSSVSESSAPTTVVLE